MRILPAFLLASLALLVASCEDGGNNPYTEKFTGEETPATSQPASTVTTSTASTAPTATTSSTTANSSSIVGTWTLTGDGTTWYATFSDNKSWIISDDKAGSKVRVYGTYSVSGGNFSGPMTNPGIGTGKIEGSFSGSVMTLYFTEYWHDPAKTVHYKGSR